MAAASKRLRLAQPTVSGQIRALEEAMEVKLFQRQGRGLVLTEAGRVAFRYAEDIFSLGREMQTALRGEATGRPLQFHVGVADVVPKLVAFHLLAPALKIGEKVLLTCEEDRAENLVDRLAAHELDIVISDAPAPAAPNVHVFSHLLGECDVTFFAPRETAANIRKRFPAALHQQPFLMPTGGTSLRRNLDVWFDKHDIAPEIIAEFDDSSLLKAFAQAGLGIFAAPSIITAEVIRQHDVRAVGTAADMKESFYAISGERRLRHPAVVAVTENARNELFKPQVAGRPSAPTR